MDIAIMSRELIKYDIITKYSSLWQDTIRGGAFTLTNTNRLVRYYDGCTGLKTGSTAKAGFCMSATAERDGMGLIAVIMGAETRDTRNAAAKALLDYGFSNFAIYKSDAKTLGEIRILGGSSKSVKVHCDGCTILVSKADSVKIQEKINLPERISAPIDKNVPIGKTEFYIEDIKIGERMIYCEYDVGKITFFEVYVAILKNLFGCK
jgi:D-alanyl-D-alanine carboxypeptidase (penicillin-binding protein 5/6)